MAKVEPMATSAQPGTEDTAVKKEAKPKKPYHPALQVDENGTATVQLIAVPDDYDPEKYRSLRKKDFESEYIFMRIQAGKLEATAKAMREEADQLEKLGSDEDRKAAKRLRSMTEKMAELRKQLEEQGIDVETLLK